MKVSIIKTCVRLIITLINTLDDYDEIMVFRKSLDIIIEYNAYGRKTSNNFCDFQIIDILTVKISRVNDVPIVKYNQRNA